ncbi:SAM-dependent methyltransferase [Phytomonospora endophytica]|uniref:tRNA-Thr(GGU) m(6)t(6)A37 methyltransferase TsaA n=1 Tax=Phytomonospora endophytica TaxID=714109 RepID=A0A841FMG6_9ACTN|nr:SAM-dependent methyltransferase [Phytomonospora endophytica]MBB6036103.1 tRNA-Thr(GGU) m(6)t(6)A37 methyltransferase TsaA [Phytomonospora endophytica]GIG67006.1 tRNA (N6-threonylcarbamoyladenosine(37)-N6)-methyltransferase TrmO [Phytomonospora endophytica]
MTTNDSYPLRALGRVDGGRTEWVEDDWADVEAAIRLDATMFEPDTTTGLEHFSHLEVVFLFDRVDPDKINLRPRPARGNPEWPPVGVFAHREPFRPNRLGVSRCRLLAVDGLTLRVAGLDALDGTPVLDVKPYLAEFGARGTVTQPGWVDDLMAEYY